MAAAPAPAPAGSPVPVDEFSQAVYYQRSGDFDNAAQRYKAILQRSDVNPQVHNNLGLLYLDRGMLPDAVAELRRALAIDPRHTGARLNLGVALMRQNSHDAAAAEFRAVLEREPRNVDAIVNLSLVERAIGSVEAAKALLLRALAIAPRNAAAHYNLAVLHDVTGERHRAVDHYRVFLESVGPEHAARAPDVRARMAFLSKQ